MRCQVITQRHDDRKQHASRTLRSALGYTNASRKQGLTLGRLLRSGPVGHDLDR